MKNDIENTCNNISYMAKWQALLALLNSHKKVAIACSGGLDSRLLAYATKMSGADYKILHIQGVHIPQEEEHILDVFSKECEIEIESYQFNPFTVEEVRKNDVTRCYHCKKQIFSYLAENSAGYTLCDGSNMDDLSVYRPGMKALEELNIYSPFIEVGITKSDIRNIAMHIELPLAGQASQACLLTRFNYNLPIEEDNVLFIDKAENAFKELIPYPFRLRGVDINTYELHIEAESMEEELLDQVNNLLHYVRLDNLKEIPVILMPSLRSYFDSQLGL